MEGSDLLSNTTVDGISVPLTGYPGNHLTLEVRDFGSPERDLVVRYEIEGRAYTVIVPWEKFTAEFDAMRARMLGSDWDTALSALVGRGESL